MGRREAVAVGPEPHLIWPLRWCWNPSEALNLDLKVVRRTQHVNLMEAGLVGLFCIPSFKNQASGLARRQLGLTYFHSVLRQH